jgi:membrane-bound lytic murein transglycosylase C
VHILISATTLRIIALTITGVILTSCTVTDRNMLIQAAESGDLNVYAEQKAKQYANNPETIVRDLISLKVLLDELKDKASDKWGEGSSDVPGNDKYVKYTDDYQSKAIVDFMAGRITVETINADDDRGQLKSAIITTLLSTDNPGATDIFSDKAPEINGKPFLFEQVLDQEGKPIRYAWRAGKFADYLIARKLKVAQTDRGLRHSVTFPMVTNHRELRKNQYAEYV